MGGRLYSTAPQRSIRVDGREILLDAEGYLCRLEDWSEAFAVTLAKQEGLALTDEHWQVVRYLRDYFRDHGVQAQVRAMIKHFTAKWGAEKGSNHYLHDIFPRGGPQKQGNRFAGLLRIKGKH